MKKLYILSVIAIIVGSMSLVVDAKETARLTGGSYKEIPFVNEINLEEVDINLVNLMIDGTVEGTLAIDNYFEGLIGRGKYKENTEWFWGPIAKISGFGYDFESFVKGIGNHLKSLI